MLVASTLLKELLMTSHRILQLNALSTAGSAIVMIAARGLLYPLFGLESPLLLDVIAIGFLAYAGALALAARRQPVTRTALMAFTIADAIWVAASAIVLMLFWSNLAPAGRLLIIAVAIVVELFATLQFNAARSVTRTPQTAY
jgi:hypothetical protein